MIKKSKTIGLVIPHYPNMFSTFYMMEIIQGVSKTLLNFKDVELFIHIERAKQPGKESNIPVLDRNIVSGVLFADKKGNEKIINLARKQGIPFIVLNYFDKKSKDNCIGIDNSKAVVDIIDYLVDLGHKKIAIINGELKVQAGRDRLHGFRKGLEKYGIKLDSRYVVEGDWSEKSGYEAMEKLLTFTKPPTAVFVAGDEMAFGAIKCVKEKGLDVPNDISIVGFDDVPLAASNSINLTTVKQPLHEAGELGIKYMLNILRTRTNKPIKILLTNTRLIVRKSTCVPKTYQYLPKQ